MNVRLKGLRWCILLSAAYLIILTDLQVWELYYTGQEESCFWISRMHFQAKEATSKVKLWRKMKCWLFCRRRERQKSDVKIGWCVEFTKSQSDYRWKVLIGKDVVSCLLLVIPKCVCVYRETQFSSKAEQSVCSGGPERWVQMWGSRRPRAHHPLEERGRRASKGTVCGFLFWKDVPWKATNQQLS